MGAIDDPVVAVVGLGYVGLPLAVAFGARCRTLGYDLSPRKAALLRERHDPTGEVEASEFARATRLAPAAGPQDIGLADIVVIAVPTPVDDAHRPDLGPLLAASRTVGQHLKRGATVVYESTVYPGATEEACVPALEGASGMRWKRDFFVAYSPERINPGDGAHRLRDITKVVAGDTPETLERVASLYASVVDAGVHRAASIRVAEAAKVIENTQRDLNIALMNELAIIFHRMGIDTREVLDAAATKWNFLRFTPGLVGGHCIGVDPYYLTHQAERLGYHPEVILAGRRINDGMGRFVARETVKCLVAAGRPVNGAVVTVLGITFKENCPDLRNSRVVDVIGELRSFGVTVHVHDPRADPQEAMAEHGIALAAWEALPAADAVVIAVAHREFAALAPGELAGRIVPGGCLIDVKGVADREAALARGLAYWRL